MPDSSKSSCTGQKDRILLIDDDTTLLDSLQMVLERGAYETQLASTAREAFSRLDNIDFDLVLTDLRMPDTNGIEITRYVRDLDGSLPVIIMTSYSTVESAIEALRAGATDYLLKPFENDELLFAVSRAVNERRIRRENSALKRSHRQQFSGRPIIGESTATKKLRDIIERAAPTDATILIQGESGTGKELVAQAIHYHSACADGPFVAINCGAIPADLLESELFGHTKGAFTGAHASTSGLIREANGGTLFLDEISTMDPQLQVKLLRVIQERQVRPIGSQQSFDVNARFVAATNEDLKDEIASGRFRADLFYRLNVIGIRVPPLRERDSDIELLAKHFVEYHSHRLGKQPRPMNDTFVAFMRTYDWPGNVRELENLIERSVIMSEDTSLTLQEVDGINIGDSQGVFSESLVNQLLTIEDYIRTVIERYQSTHSDKEIAAMLGIGRKALWERRRKWGVSRDRTKT